MARFFFVLALLACVFTLSVTTIVPDTSKKIATPSSKTTTIKTSGKGWKSDSSDSGKSDSGKSSSDDDSSDSDNDSNSDSDSGKSDKSSDSDDDSSDS